MQKPQELPKSLGFFFKRQFTLAQSDQVCMQKNYGPGLAGPISDIARE
jgi:hypothetical protein